MYDTVLAQPRPLWANLPTEEHQARVAKAQREMQAAGLDILMLTQKENVVYFSGFRCGHWGATTFPTAILLIHATEDPVLIVPDFFSGTARDSSWITELRFFSEPHANPRGASKVIVEAVHELGGGSARIGIESGQNLVSTWNLADYHAVREGLPDATFTSAADVLWSCRMIKSPLEIAALKSITNITERAMVATKDELHAGMTETDVARATAAHAFGDGVENVVFANVRCGRERYRSADSLPYERSVRRGEMMVYDMGFSLGNYVSDIAYNTHIGPPTDKHHEVWSVIVRAQEVALAAMRPGVRARDVYQVCHQVMADYGFGRFLDMVGHGIGMDVHEPPILAPYDERILEAGMVFAVEPWIYDTDGIGVFALEEIVAVTEDGIDLLSTVPRDELWSTRD